VPLEDVIEFKRDVYKAALNELSSHLHHKIKPSPHTKSDASHAKQVN